MPITVFETNIFAVANNTEESPCYLRARMCRGRLYSKARELGCNKIALSHHFNDVIETTLRRLKRDSPNIEKSIFNTLRAVTLDTFPSCEYRF